MPNHMRSELVMQLLAEPPSQDCKLCEADCVAFIRCGRGDCAAIEDQRKQAAVRIEQLESLAAELLPWAEDALEQLLKSNCLLNDDLSPKRETLDPDAEDLAVELEELISRAAVALPARTAETTDG